MVNAWTETLFPGVLTLTVTADYMDSETFRAIRDDPIDDQSPQLQQEPSDQI